MYITFKNNSTTAAMIVIAENTKHVINPEESVEVLFTNEKAEFTTQTLLFKELIDAVNELDNETENKSFKDRILAKLAKKFFGKMPEAFLDISVKYELICPDFQDTVVNLYDGEYSVCDGKIASFLDFMPVAILFSRAEADNSLIKVLDVMATNRKKYMKLTRNILLLAHSSFIFIELFTFIPEYFTIKFLSSQFYIKRLVIGLYNKNVAERARIFEEKQQKYEKEEKSGCLGSIIKCLILLLIIGGICYRSITSEPDVIVSEDFKSVICFDETFVKIDGELPQDAKKTFLEEYNAYYILPDGGYDMDNYYCYIYEDSAGTRYMWLKDSCSEKENADKEYDEYENPLVYKSVEN